MAAARAGGCCNGACARRRIARCAQAHFVHGAAGLASLRSGTAAAARRWTRARAGAARKRGARARALRVAATRLLRNQPLAEHFARNALGLRRRRHHVHAAAEAAGKGAQAAAARQRLRLDDDVGRRAARRRARQDVGGHRRRARRRRRHGAPRHDHTVRGEQLHCGGGAGGGGGGAERLRTARGANRQRGAARARETHSTNTRAPRDSAAQRPRHSPHATARARGTCRRQRGAQGGRWCKEEREKIVYR